MFYVDVAELLYPALLTVLELNPPEWTVGEKTMVCFNPPRH